MERSAIPRSPWPISLKRRSNAAMLSLPRLPLRKFSDSRLLQFTARLPSVPRSPLRRRHARSPRLLQKPTFSRHRRFLGGAAVASRRPSPFQFFARDESFFLCLLEISSVSVIDSQRFSFVLFHFFNEKFRWKN